MQSYNENMGGVDLFDQLMAVYTTSGKSRRWWMRLFYYLLDAAVVNSYTLYKVTFMKAFPHRKPLTHLEFT
ncbi:hypothetical protein ACUWCL_28980, partial [Klebsiella pneumoniae]|uniref:hypothetical protein n=1 Tax=Klebsiella pneumoniae TaxID=573 RepID=UPI0040555472